jgi:hypothetical protein
MNDDLEAKMRAAMRPVAPGDELSRKLVASLAAVEPKKRSNWWIPASLAASMLLAFGVQHHLREQRDLKNGLEARREVLEALRMTSQKLNLAYEAVKSQSSSLDAEKPGA